MLVVKEVHVGDIDTAFDFVLKNQNDVAVDLSAADVVEVHYSKPSGATGAWDADGDASGNVTGTFTSLDEAGLWDLQIKVEFTTTTDEKWSNVDTLYVHPNVTV